MKSTVPISIGQMKQLEQYNNRANSGRLNPGQVQAAGAHNGAAAHVAAIV